MLNVEAIDLHYGAAQALRRVSVTAEIGKVTCVMGRNGVGKTSLMRAIVGQQAITRRQDQLRRRGHLDAAHRGPRAAPASPTCRRAARSSRC